VPVKPDPRVPRVPLPSVLPVRTCVIVKVSPEFASVSLSSTTSPDPSATVNVASSFTLPVSLTATGGALEALTVIVIKPVSVAVPSETV